MSEAAEIVFHDRKVAIARQAVRFGDVSFPLASIGGVLAKAPKKLRGGQERHRPAKRKAPSATKRLRVRSDLAMRHATWRLLMITDRIEKKILLQAPVERVWRAISEAARFGSWFGMAFDAPFAQGARLTGKIVPTTVDAEVAKLQKPFEGHPFEIFIERIEPMRRFSFRWHPYAIDRDVDYSKEPTTLIVFELEEAPGGTLLKISESGFDRIPLARRAKAFAANEGGWAKQTQLIEKYLAMQAGA
jgi:uncharacterized protein YndB with AHSA1/START domain